MNGLDSDVDGPVAGVVSEPSLDGDGQVVSTRLGLIPRVCLFNSRSLVNKLSQFHLQLQR